MAYLGTPIDTTNQFQSLQGKRFSGDGSTTAFTLDIAPSSVFDIEVFVENVRQDPNSAYGISGTTLTFTGAPPSGTNNIYVVHQAKAVGTINPTNDSVTASSIADDAVESEHLNDNIISGQTALGAEPADTDEFLVSDAGTIKRIDYSYIKGGTNTPSFYAYLTSTTTVTSSTATKITFDTEEWDTNSAYDTSTGKFTVPSGQDGKYQVASHLWCSQTGGEGKFYLGGVRLYKNGSLFSYAQSDFNTAGDDSANNHNAGFVAPIDLSAGDYLEIYAIVGAHTGTTQVLTGTKSSWFSVHKLIGV